MNITLIHPTSPFLLNQAVFPPLGILYLASYLKQHGHGVKCVDLGLNPEFKAEIGVLAESEIVGVSFTSAQRFEAFTIAKTLSAAGKVVIAGGAHATHAPQDCLDAGFNVAIKGEGEIPLLYFMNNPHVRGILEGEDFTNINSQLFPDRDLLPIRDYKYTLDGELCTVLMSSRGCPFHCSFCARVTKHYRCQHAFRTVSEMLHLREHYGYKALMFFDDVFTLDKERLQDIARLLDTSGENGKFKIRCFSRTNLLSPETVWLLQKIGVVEVGLGVESGSNTILSQNLKGTTTSLNTRAVKLLQLHGIRAKAFLIVGLPGETEETVRETEQWIKEAQPDDIDVSVLQPYPGSSLFDDPAAWGIEFDKQSLSFYKGTPGQYISTVRTKHLSPEQIVNFRDELETKYKRKELLR